MCLLLNSLIKLPSLPSKVLVEVRELYRDVISTNCDIGHRWAEIVVKNKVRSGYSAENSFSTVFCSVSEGL